MPSETTEECVVNLVSSRACERGTKGCDVTHETTTNEVQSAIKAVATYGGNVNETLWAGKTLARRVQELEAERNAWQSLDGINWYERAKKAERQLASAERVIDKVTHLNPQSAALSEKSRYREKYPATHSERKT